MSTKIWDGTDTGNEGKPETAANWKPISIRNALYKWTASGGGTNEYYCELAGGGDPSLEDPFLVQIDGADATEGTVGSLNAGEWDYGDGDTLGYNTVYVRLTGGGDPDAQDIDHITFTNTLQAADNMYMQGSENLDLELDQSGIALTTIDCPQKFTGEIGTADDYLHISATTVNIGQHHGSDSPSGSGRVKLDLGTTAATVNIDNSGTSSETGKQAIQILCNNAATDFRIRKGSVSIADGPGEISTFDDIDVSYVSN